MSSLQYFEKVFFHGFFLLFSRFFCFVVAAFICRFCICMTYSTSYCHYGSARVCARSFEWGNVAICLEELGQFRKLSLWNCQASGWHSKYELFERVKSALLMRQEWNGKCTCYLWQFPGTACMTGVSCAPAADGYNQSMGRFSSQSNKQEQFLQERSLICILSLCFLNCIATCN